MGGGQMVKWPSLYRKREKKYYNIFSSKKPMKALLNFYLASALSVTTVATGACFVWYVQEYGAAYKYHKVAPEISQIHRNNSLWLGLWGGIYGLTGVVSAIGLSQGIKKEQ
jgi:hypothetical protein